MDIIEIDTKLFFNETMELTAEERGDYINSSLLNPNNVNWIIRVGSINELSRNPSKQLRNEILKRDSYKCVFCGDTENLEIDHIIPYSKGGKTTRENLQTLCIHCNRKKSNK